MVLRNVVAVLPAAASVALAAPGATASHAFHGCFVAAARVHGDVRHHGVLAGQAEVDGAVTLTCRITVNGADVAVSGPVSGDTVVTTADQVAFAIRDGDVVRVCADVTDSAGSATYCSVVDLPVVDLSWVPGVDLVAETVHGVLNTYFWPNDFMDCELLQGLAPGIHPVVDINSEGDVWLNGEQVVDCPPYYMGWGTHPIPAHRRVLFGSVRTV